MLPYYTEVFSEKDAFLAEDSIFLTEIRSLRTSESCDIESRPVLRLATTKASIYRKNDGDDRWQMKWSSCWGEFLI